MSLFFNYQTIMSCIFNLEVREEENDESSTLGPVTLTIRPSQGLPCFTSEYISTSRPSRISSLKSSSSRSSGNVSPSRSFTTSSLFIWLKWSGITTWLSTVWGGRIYLCSFFQTFLSGEEDPQAFFADYPKNFELVELLLHVLLDISHEGGEDGAEVCRQNTAGGGGDVGDVLRFHHGHYWQVTRAGIIIRVLFNPDLITLEGVSVWGIPRAWVFFLTTESKRWAGRGLVRSCLAWSENLRVLMISCMSATDGEMQDTMVTKQWGWRLSFNTLVRAESL